MWECGKKNSWPRTLTDNGQRPHNMQSTKWADLAGSAPIKARDEFPAMTSERNKRIAKNTLMLYIRQLLILFVSLYTVRIVLDQLGVENYGIYGAVGGLVALSAFLPGSLAMATQRFFSFALGERNEDRLKKTFSVNLALYAGVALIAFILLQTIGLWFVNNQLAVPDGRFASAKALYHYATFTFMASVLTTPFMPIIMAHEDIKIYAYISI